MFSNAVSEVVTILTQALMITIAGWTVVFAWQDIGGVENFKSIVFRRRDRKTIQKRSYQSKQNKAYSRLDFTQQKKNC